MSDSTHILPVKSLIMFDRSRPIREIMSDRVIMVSPDTVMTEVARLFQVNRVHHIPVVHSGHVVGMISTADLHRLEHHFTLFRTTQAEEVNAAILGSILAREVMSPQVVTVRGTDSVQFAADIFKENLFRALPVVDEEKRIIGMLTPYDLMVYAYNPDPRQIGV